MNKQKHQQNIFTLFTKIFRQELGRNNELQVSYRIINLPTEKDTHVHFQIIGKGIVLKMTPAKIMRDEMLMGFSKADIALITHYGTKAEYQAESNKKRGILSRIVQQLFGDKQSAFLIHDAEQEKVIEKTAQELYFDPSTKERFSSADALVIGYSAAEERYRQLVAETKFKPEYEMLSIGDGAVFYRHHETQHVVNQSAETLFNTPKVFKKFNADDRSLISYTAAEARYQRIMKETKAQINFKLCNTAPDDHNCWQYQSLSTGDLLMTSVDALFYDTNTLKQFSADDLSLIAFAAGELSKKRQLELATTH